MRSVEMYGSVYIVGPIYRVAFVLFGKIGVKLRPATPCSLGHFYPY